MKRHALYCITWLIGEGFRAPCLATGDAWGLLISCKEMERGWLHELTRRILLSFKAEGKQEQNYICRSHILRLFIILPV